MYLDDQYSNEYITEQLSLEFEGANRIKKALRIVNKIIPNNPLCHLLIENRGTLRNVLKRRKDRNVILIAMLNAAFPFSFDTLSCFGKYFSVQEYVNTETIKKDISKIYGGNRSTENGLYSVIPMFLEAEFFTRPKPGLYQYEQGILVLSSFTKDIYNTSFNHCTDAIIDAKVDNMHPYFVFVGRKP
jgi:hypothetical protein